eukprot:TRINITY_DN1386_c0_g1_i2.p1 TRINITY_DN1386_c0_g1~~TRINITY_DN1386_c0_g1_i2.p1  ORF type:complete len:168 (+),score=19.48 TRINITY_DN1386_c0_g1_i2:82-585(+)
MQIFATSHEGRTAAFNVEASTAIRSVRGQVQETFGFPSNDFLVTFAGQILSPDQAIFETGISDGSTVSVSLALSGGGDGTEAFGKMHKKTHGLCPRCGKRSYHKQNKRCAACGYPAAKKRSYEWSKKSKRRTAPGTGRCKYIKHIARRAKNGFRSGTTAPPRRKNQK